MIKKSHLTFILLPIIFLILFAIIFSIADINDNFVIADDSTFEVFFPTTHYIQFNNPTFISKSNEYFCIYDNVEKKILIIDSLNNQQILNVSDYYPIQNMWILENVLIIQNGTNNYSKYIIPTSTTFETITLSSHTHDISSISSDGYRLYVKSSNGFITIFDKNLDIYNSICNLKIDRLFGNIKFAGYSNKVASFYLNEQFELTITTLTSQQINNKQEIGYVQPNYIAYNGDYIYAYFSVEKKIAVFSSNCTLVYEKDFSLSNMIVFGDELYCVQNDKIGVYKLIVDENDYALDEINYFSMNGSDKEHLHNPSDVVLNQNILYISDTNNNRILVHDTSDNSFITTININKPLQIAFESTNKWFILSNNEINEFNKLTKKSTYTKNNISFISMSWMNKLYVLGKDNNSGQISIYTLYASDFHKLIDDNNAIDLTTTPNGSFIYVLSTKNGQQIINCYDKNGNKSLIELTLDGINAKKIRVDAVGNIYVLTNDSKLIKYLRKADSYEIEITLSLSNTIYNSIINNFTLTADNSVIFTSENSFIGKATINHTDEVTPTPTPNINGKEIVFYKTNKQTLFFIEPNQLEVSEIIEENTLIPIFNDTSVIPGLLYGYYNNIYGYFNENYLSIAPTNSPTEQNVVTIEDNVKLYEFPFLTANNINIEQNVVLEFIDDLLDYDNANWYKIRYQNKIYYILRSSVTNYSNEEQVVEPIYCKAQTKRIGGQINLYATPIENSEIIAKIADGQTLEVYDEIDGFYFVKYKGKSGYAKISDVKLSGLTSSQIIGIILAILTIIAGASIFVITNISRKKQHRQIK